MELLNSKEKLEEAFRKFVNSTQVSEDDVLGIVSLDRANRYKEYIYKTIIDGFNIKTYRERIVSFLAALEYRKTINPQFQIQFNIFDKIEESLKDDNLLLLGFEYKDGRHYEDVGVNGIRLTVPFNLQKNSDLLKQTVKLGAMNRSFYDIWTNAEEMIQIIGVASAGKYIVVDRNSDLSAFCERNRSIRWGHKSFPAEDVINTNYAMAKMLVPNENEYLRSLFSLHGLDFQEYKQRIKENNLSSAK